MFERRYSKRCQHLPNGRITPALTLYRRYVAMSDNADNPDSFCLCLCPEEAEMLDATVEQLRIMRFLQVVALLSAAPIFAAEPSTSTAATAINALGIDLLRK